ncbi:uncharacterized protein LAJ45_07071 [Morchella importuna]|uniref:uncharacterized protein n=1 Tax=Morchella importuna TaxID=1174673 RepID=UPI001E8D9937|nr:uncharacterized protein LAJ45_07071 [Morchella importuna]KAH8148728.1 hypothetical protein LAJ45_07071 [Morchella importuna]
MIMFIKWWNTDIFSSHFNTYLSNALFLLREIDNLYASLEAGEVPFLFYFSEFRGSNISLEEDIGRRHNSTSAGCFRISRIEFSTPED